MKGRTGQGIWRLADPKITSASLASMFLGACAAARDGPLAWGWLVLTAVGIFFLEAAKNASGELFDFASGTDQAVAPEDRSPFSGGKRVLVDGFLTSGEAAAVAWIAYGLAVLSGILIVALREPAVLWLGLIGLALAFFYHAGKRTLVVRLGRPAASRAFAWIVGVALACLPILPPLGVPRTVWLGAAGIPFAVAAARRLKAYPESTPRQIPAQAWTLLSFVLFALGAGFGLVLSPASH